MLNSIRPHRLFVSGASRLSKKAAILWHELGSLLAEENGLVVITGGLSHLVNDPLVPTADWKIIEGMLAVLHARGKSPDTCIETILPDPQYDWPKLVRFKEGLVQVLKNRNAQSRRFSLVHSADVVISIEGEHGTQSVLDVALAIGRPVLPLPFGKNSPRNASKKFWHAERDEICNWFRIEPEEVKYFESICLPRMNILQIRELAEKVRTCLLRGFTQGCFVIMRFHKNNDPVFDKAIKPALLANGFQPWRTDRSVNTGDVVAAIHDGINHCFFAIADTTGDRPNVMYELGLAHAINKPVILLRRANADGSLPPVPFDFHSKSIHSYTDDLNALRIRLEAVIAEMSGKGRGVDEVG